MGARDQSAGQSGVGSSRQSALLASGMAGCLCYLESCLFKRGYVRQIDKVPLVCKSNLNGLSLVRVNLMQNFLLSLITMRIPWGILNQGHISKSYPYSVTLDR